MTDFILTPSTKCNQCHSNLLHYSSGLHALQLSPLTAFSQQSYCVDADKKKGNKMLTCTKNDISFAVIPKTSALKFRNIPIMKAILFILVIFTVHNFSFMVQSFNDLRSTAHIIAPNIEADKNSRLCQSRFKSTVHKHKHHQHANGATTWRFRASACRCCRHLVWHAS